MSKTTATTPPPDAAFAGATDAELAALDALGKEGTWHVGGHELKLTNLDKPLFEPRPAPVPPREPPRPRAPSPSASSSATSPASPPRCCPISPTGRSTCSASPTAPRAPGFWQKNLPDTSPRWLTRWHETGVDGRTDRNANEHLIADNVGGPVLARQPGELRDPRLDRQAARAVAAHVRLHRYRSRRQDDLGRDPRAGPALSDRPAAPRRARLSQDHRQARHPGLDPDRARPLRLLRDERLGREGQPGGRRHRPGARSPGSGPRRRARVVPASTTPRTPASRPWSRRTASGRRPGRRCARPSPGTSSTTRTCAPIDGPSATSSSAWPRSVTSSRPLRPTPRSSPRSERGGGTIHP